MPVHFGPTVRSCCSGPLLLHPNLFASSVIRFRWRDDIVQVNMNIIGLLAEPGIKQRIEGVGVGGFIGQ